MTDYPAGVLFDFTGTLFWVEDADTAVAQSLGPKFAHLAPELARRGAINGAGRASDLPRHLERAWAERDLDPALHRDAYSGLGEASGLTRAQAQRLYDRGLTVGAWHPYADTRAVLRTLHAAAVPVALVSNIGWDPRPVLDGYDVLDLFTTLVLSDERGVQKPDPAIFEVACRELGVAGADVLMIGDTDGTDGAAVRIGARFVLVDSSPDRAADALLRAVTPHRDMGY